MPGMTNWGRGYIGNCTICGEEDRLLAMCPRCNKYACYKKDCVQAIGSIKLCSVPKHLIKP